jgi:hypothetical protein
MDLRLICKATVKNCRIAFRSPPSGCTWGSARGRGCTYPPLRVDGIRITEAASIRIAPGLPTASARRLAISGVWTAGIHPVPPSPAQPHRQEILAPGAPRLQRSSACLDPLLFDLELLQSLLERIDSRGDICHDRLPAAVYNRAESIGAMANSARERGTNPS